MLTQSASMHWGASGEFWKESPDTDAVFIECKHQQNQWRQTEKNQKQIFEIIQTNFFDVAELF